MRIEHGHLGVELGLDLGKRDFALALDLLMDDVVLRLLLLDLHLVRGGGLVSLRPRLHRQQLWIGRRRRWRQWRMQQLAGLRIDRGRVIEEPVRVLVPHDLGQLGCGVIEFAVADQIDFSTRDQLFLNIGERHQLRELLRPAAGADAEADIDGHAIAGLPTARIDIAPGVTQPDRLLLLARVLHRMCS